MSQTATTPHVPMSLVFEQGPMIRTLGRILIQSLVPIGRPTHNPETFQTAEMIVPAPSAKLVASYAAWCGAVSKPDVLPPHMFSQWALPAATRVLEQTRYSLAGIINQGVSMRINGDLPAGQPILVTARLHTLEETAGRARVAIEISSGTRQQPDAVVATLHVTFILPAQPKAPKQQKQSAPAPAVHADWRTVGTWQTTRDDGFRFALLTGDFNPIHWIGIAGRLSAFKSMVLHGFGMFVRSYEALASAGTVQEIDVRFLRPVSLPSPALRVQQSEADSDGWQALRLIGSGDRLHMAGRFRR